MTVEDIIAEHPWMEVFKERIQEKCSGCNCNYNEQHTGDCDVARCNLCGKQKITCRCEKGEPDVWTGLIMPELHKIAIEDDLWCRSFIIIDGKEFPCNTNMIDLFQEVYFNNPLSVTKDEIVCGEKVFPVKDDLMKNLWLEIKSKGSWVGTVKFHESCKKEDPGAWADLNRAWSHR